MNRPTIGLALIAKNEERNIRQLLESVQGCFDEIHLTDTGSTDRTVELAMEMGCIVHHFDWCDDFAAARNASFEPVKTDYIAWLDLDDVLENRDAFILWRDNVMGLADYWAAVYHYSSDPTGKPLCSFARERVVKRDKGFRWKYFCHEGIIPDSSSGPVKMHFVQTWKVRHMRTAEDLQADRSRNLRIFEKNKHRFDPRMRYYYGKELFEAGKPIEAIHELLVAVAEPQGIELHDRTLALQYACYAYVQCNQFEQAINTAHSGLMLAPSRAEFHCVLGDSYLKMNRLVDAIPAYQAAKACSLPGSNGATPIFHTEDLYSLYPRNQLAKLYFHLGDMDRALAEATECREKHEHIETHTIVKEIEGHKKATLSFKDAKPCEDIVISCPPQAPYLWDADIAKDKAMGGSETAAIEMANWIYKLSGRPVKVFNVRDEDKICDGVDYISNKKLPQYMAENKPWLHIAWRHNIKLTDAKTFLWCHDLVTMGAENHANFEKILCLTPFHKRYVQAVQGIPEDKIHVTRNGLKPERFAGGPWEKDPYRFVFGNSPDRGLDRCIRVLDRVREKYPQITLAVHYGIEHLPQYGLKDLHDKLKMMIAERPWIEYHGSTQQDALMASYKKSAYWLSPSDFIETSMISAMELVCCGVYPIFRGIGGVVDTLRPFVEAGMATQVDSDCITELEYKKYIDATIEAIEREAWKTVKADPEELSWRKVAENWLQELPRFAEASPSTGTPDQLTTAK